VNRRSITRGGAALVPVVIFLTVYLLFWPADVPLIGPDSLSYVDFHAIRTGGYPFFLNVLKLIFFDRSHYVIAQCTLYALSVLLFAWQLLKTERNLFFCLIVEVGLLANWEVNRYHFSLITETLFLSIKRVVPGGGVGTAPNRFARLARGRLGRCWRLCGGSCHRIRLPSRASGCPVCGAIRHPHG
jgi:hypothetical protein